MFYTYTKFGNDKRHASRTFSRPENEEPCCRILSTRSVAQVGKEGRRPLWRSLNTRILYILVLTKTYCNNYLHTVYVVENKASIPPSILPTHFPYKMHTNSAFKHPIQTHLKFQCFVIEKLPRTFNNNNLLKHN